MGAGATGPEIFFGTRGVGYPLLRGQFWGSIFFSALRAKIKAGYTLSLTPGGLSWDRPTPPRSPNLKISGRGRGRRGSPVPGGGGDGRGGAGGGRGAGGAVPGRGRRGIGPSDSAVGALLLLRQGAGPGQPSPPLLNSPRKI